MIHHHKLRVYYEDTDLAGIVYYANYLRFMERGRSDMVRELGIDQTVMKAAGIVFAVRRVEADYLLPARFDDQLIIETVTARLSGASFDMGQRVLRNDDVILTAKVKIVCMTPEGKPLRIPADIRQKLANSSR